MVHTHTHACLPTYIHTHINTVIHVCLHIYIHKCDLQNSITESEFHYGNGIPLNSFTVMEFH